jgi:hypothetical protein
MSQPDFLYQLLRPLPPLCGCAESFRRWQSSSSLSTRLLVSRFVLLIGGLSSSLTWQACTDSQSIASIEPPPAVPYGNGVDVCFERCHHFSTNRCGGASGFKYPSFICCKPKSNGHYRHTCFIHVRCPECSLLLNIFYYSAFVEKHQKVLWPLGTCWIRI